MDDLSVAPLFSDDPIGNPRPAAHAVEAVDRDAFREAMRSLASTISVVTAGQGAERTGFTATSVCSFSVDPPCLLVCLDRSSSSWPAVERHGAFCVNVMAEGQAAIADQFAGRNGFKGAARFEGIAWRELATGAPALSDALVSIDCELDEAIIRHSHVILIGRVAAIALGAREPPLLYWHRGYRRLTDIAP